jgi:hypothetical protein
MLQYFNQNLNATGPIVFMTLVNLSETHLFEHGTIWIFIKINILHKV